MYTLSYLARSYLNELAVTFLVLTSYLELSPERSEVSTRNETARPFR